LKYTDAGRKVYGGGGIEPDKFFAGPIDGFNPTRFGRSLAARQAFATFAERFTAEGDTRMGAATAGKTKVAKGFAITDAMVRDFKQSLVDQKVRIDEDAWTKDAEFIRAEIHYAIDEALFGVREAQKNLIAHDPQAQFALTQFADAARLLELSKARTTARGNAQ
jgi:carboxyl-terminal processing protease